MSKKIKSYKVTVTVEVDATGKKKAGLAAFTHLAEAIAEKAGVEVEVAKLDNEGYSGKYSSVFVDTADL